MNRSELIAACFSEPLDKKNGEPDLHVEFVLEDHLDPGADRVIAHVGICWRTVETTIGSVQTAGIALVCVDPAFRKLGLMHSTMLAAHAVAREHGREYAGLYTDSPWLYHSLGYRQIPEGPGVPPHFMWASLDGGQWRTTVVDTRGVW